MKEPATPLPLKFILRTDGNRPGVFLLQSANKQIVGSVKRPQDAEYIVHACNNYPELEHYKRRLGDLLAVIHRDGGHHTGNVGIDQSIDDARTRVLEYIHGGPNPELVETLRDLTGALPTYQMADGTECMGENYDALYSALKKAKALLAKCEGVNT